MFLEVNAKHVILTMSLTILKNFIGLLKYGINTIYTQSMGKAPWLFVWANLSCYLILRSYYCDILFIFTFTGADNKFLHWSWRISMRMLKIDTVKALNIYTENVRYALICQQDFWLWCMVQNILLIRFSAPMIFQNHRELRWLW